MRTNLEKLCQRIDGMIAKTARLSDELRALKRYVLIEEVTPMTADEIVGENISERVKHARESLGMSQAEFASRIGMTASQMCKLENGYQGMTLATLLRLSRALGVTVGALVD